LKEKEMGDVVVGDEVEVLIDRIDNEKR